MTLLKKLFSLLFCISAMNIVYPQSSIAYDYAWIDVSDKLTTHLIFQEEIDYIDIGANEFSVDKIKNVVKIKCTDLDNWNIKEKTNLTVVTKNGFYYSLWVFYKKNPKIKTYIYTSENAIELQTFNSLNSSNLKINKCNRLLSKNPNIVKKDSNHKMKYQVNGIFYEKDKIILRLKIENQSRINFTTDSIRFLLTTKKRFNLFKSLKKLDALQYVEKNAGFICNNTKDVLGNSNQTILFGFDRFVPTKDEVLEVRIAENNSGGRRGKIVLNIEDFLLKDNNI